MRCHHVSLIEIFNLSENSLCSHSTWDFNLVAKISANLCAKCSILYLVDYSRVHFPHMTDASCYCTLQCPWHLALSHKVELKSNSTKPQHLFRKTFYSQPVDFIHTSIRGSVSSEMLFYRSLLKTVVIWFSLLPLYGLQRVNPF